MSTERLDACFTRNNTLDDRAVFVGYVMAGDPA